MGINNIVRGKGYKQFMAKLYGIGASIVILGALFKINHYTGANEMLIVGLGTEALIFFFSAFEPLHVEYDWSLVYPELGGMLDEDYKKGKQKKGTLTQELDKMLADAKIGPELIESLGAGLRNLSETTSQLSSAKDAAVATDDYVKNIKIASSSVEELSASYKKTAEGLNNDLNLSETYVANLQKASEAVANLSDIYNFTADSLKNDGGSYHQQLEKMANNLSSLNALYEMQLQASNEQLETANKVQDNVQMFLNNLNDSVENTVKYKEQVDALTKKVAALNNVYGNMLSAMTMGNNA